MKMKKKLKNSVDALCVCERISYEFIHPCKKMINVVVVDVTIKWNVDQNKTKKN